MFRLTIGMLVGIGLVIFWSTEASLSEVKGSVRSLLSGNSSQAMDRWIEAEKQRVNRVRDEFVQWKSVEVCRKDLSEFERFTRDRGISASPSSCH